MAKVKTIGVLFSVAIIVTGAIAIAAKSSDPVHKVSVRKLDQQVVLYTIYRGSYGKTGPEIGKLFALAGKEGMMPPRGPLAYAYLNNPKFIAEQHWLTEIRIPVAATALEKAGTLGPMTDVKQLPAMEVAVVQKPVGMADPSPLYECLTTWMNQNGYVATDSPFEVFLSNAQSGNYAQMKSEIMIPIAKITPEKD